MSLEIKSEISDVQTIVKNGDENFESPVDVNKHDGPRADSTSAGDNSLVLNACTIVAPQVRVEELREDGQSSAGVSDMDDTLSDIESGRSPVVSDHENANISPNQEKPFEEPTEELQDKIVTQVEFYFSDANILKDAFLLKHVKRNKLGYVSLKLVTSFRKMKALTKDYRVVAFSVKKSTKLEVNEEGTKVRRIEPLPDYDETTPSRTIVAINLPFENPGIENVAEMFSHCGEISLIRVLKPGKSLPPDVKKHISKHPELGNIVCAVVEFEHHLGAKTACDTMTDLSDWRRGLSVSLLAIKKQEKNKTDQKSKKNNDKKNKAVSHGSTQDQIESHSQGDEEIGENKKKTAMKNKVVNNRTLGEGDFYGVSSDDEQVKQGHTSLSAKPEVARLTPSSTPRSTPRNTPKTSPRNSPNIHRKRTPHGKSPLAVDSLSPGTSPKPSPCVSPESLRRGPSKSDSSVTPSPGCSPWLQRKLKAQQEAGTKSPLVGTSPMASPRLGRRLLDLEGVLRQPKGPDGTKGFYGGVGRGKQIQSE